MVTYLEGKLGTREERQGMFMRKWGFRCDCRICQLPEDESSAKDVTIRYVREMQQKISLGKFGAKSGLSHTACLQELHKLLDCRRMLLASALSIQSSRSSWEIVSTSCSGLRSVAMMILLGGSE